MSSYFDIPTAITAPQAAILRSGPHITRPLVFVTPKTSVCAGTISSVPKKYPFTFYGITVTSGSASAIKEGMLVLIGTAAGKADIQFAIIKEAYAPGTHILIDPHGRGDSGLAINRNFIAQVGHHFTIIKHFPLWTRFSAIRGVTAYKDYNDVFVDQTKFPDPVSNVGPWQAEKCAVGTGKATFTLDATQSYGWARNLSTFVWDIDGATVATGSVTSSQLTVTADPGFYIFTCTVTDTAGKKAKGRVYAWAWNDTTFKPFNHTYVTQISRDNQDQRSRTVELSVTFERGSRYDDFYPTMGVFVFEDTSYGGSTVPASIITDRFAGYAYDETLGHEQHKTTVRIEAKGPLGVAADLPNAPQLMTYNANPTNWTECGFSLMSPLGAAYYILRFHCPAIVENHDFKLRDNTWLQRKKSFELSANSIGGQLDQVAEMMRGNIGSRSDGATILMQHPWKWMYVSERDALPVWFTMASGDLRGEVEYPILWGGKVGNVTGQSFAWDGGTQPIPFKAIAPGRTQSQGKDKPNMPFFIVSAADGLQRTLWVTGQEFAYLNRRHPTVRMPILGNMDIFDAADIRQIYDLEITELAIPEGTITTGTSHRGIVSQVSRAWRQTANGSWIKEIDVEFDLESLGQHAEQLPIEEGGAWLPASGWLPSDISAYDPIAPEWSTVPNLALTWNDAGVLKQTVDFDAQRPSWENLMGAAALDGLQIFDCAWDYNSPFFQSSGSLNVYAVAVDFDAAELYVLRGSGVESGSITWATLTTQAITPSSFNEFTIAIASGDESTFENRVLVVWVEGTKVKALRTINSGTNWTVTSTALDAGANVGEDGLGALCDGDWFYTTASPNAIVWNVYRAQGTGAWAAMPNKPTDDFLEPVRNICRLGSDLVVSANISDATETSSTPNSDYKWGDKASTGTDASLIGASDIPGFPTTVQASDDTGAPSASRYYGFNKRLQTPDQANNDIGYDIDAVCMEFSFMLRLSQTWSSGGSPNWYPDNWAGSAPFDGVTFELYMKFYDRDGNVIHTTPTVSYDWFMNTTAANSAESAWLADPVWPDTENIVAYTAGDIGDYNYRLLTVNYCPNLDVTLEDVNYIDFYFRSVNTVANNSTGKYTYTDDGGSSTEPMMDFAVTAVASYVDDECYFWIFWDVERTPGSSIGERWATYKITTPTGVAAWTDVTPTGDYGAVNFRALTEGIGESTVWLLGDEPDGTRSVLSYNGTVWTTETTQRLQNAMSIRAGIVSSTDLMLLYGPYMLDMSVDNLGSRYDRLGDWGVDGGVYRIKGILLATV